jgi:hypothetical protein
MKSTEVYNIESKVWEDVELETIQAWYRDYLAICVRHGLCINYLGDLSLARFDRLDNHRGVFNIDGVPDEWWAKLGDNEVTGLVKMHGIVEELGYLTRCVCGQEYKHSILVQEKEIWYGSDSLSEPCAKCGRRLYFETEFHIYEVESEQEATRVGGKENAKI